jgi:hypothetical protein
MMAVGGLTNKQDWVDSRSSSCHLESYSSNSSSERPCHRYKVINCQNLSSCKLQLTAEYSVDGPTSNIQRHQRLLSHPQHATAPETVVLKLPADCCPTCRRSLQDPDFLHCFPAARLAEPGLGRQMWEHADAVEGVA